MKKLFAALALAAMLSACGPSYTPVPATPAVPVPVQPTQGVDGSSAAIGAVAGAVGGYMLGRANTPRYGYGYHAPVIIHQAPVIVHRVVLVYGYRPSVRSYSYRRR